MRHYLWVMALGLLVGACDSDSFRQEGKVVAQSGSAINRAVDPEVLALGEQIYRQHCQQCHQEGARGVEDWRVREPDGLFPPPPLNGSGHAWHHPAAELRRMIKEGSRPGEGKMPAWQGKLSDEEIDAVVIWFQSLWPDPVYARWYDREQRGF